MDHVKILLISNASVNIKDMALSHTTPLHVSIIEGSERVVTMLLDQGRVNVDLRAPLFRV